MKIAIIGGAGRMGRWLTKYFLTQTHEIVISDINLENAKTFEENGVDLAENNVTCVQNADFVIVATPIQEVSKVIREIAPFMKPESVLAEISSLKKNVIETLMKVSKNSIHPISIHPLFGPGVQDLKGWKIAVIPLLNSKLEVELTKKFFSQAQIILVDAETHDRAMALILSLPHFINVIFAQIISEEDFSLLRKLEGTTFKLQQTLAGSVMTEDPLLQADIQMENTYTLHFLHKFIYKAKKLQEMIEKKQKTEFTALYTEIHNALPKDFTQTYHKMYEFLEKL
jgi:prephenate dehydrogenase